VEHTLSLVRLDWEDRVTYFAFCILNALSFKPMHVSSGICARPSLSRFRGTIRKYGTWFLRCAVKGAVF